MRSLTWLTAQRQRPPFEVRESPDSRMERGEPHRETWASCHVRREGSGNPTRTRARTYYVSNFWCKPLFSHAEVIYDSALRGSSTRRTFLSVSAMALSGATPRIDLQVRRSLFCHGCGERKTGWQRRIKMLFAKKSKEPVRTEGWALLATQRKLQKGKRHR